MGKALEQYAKRRTRKIIVEGEESFVRDLTRGEMRRVDAMDDASLKDALSMGFMLLEIDGSQVFTRQDNETDADFAKRIEPMLDDIPVGTIRDIAFQAVKASKPDTLETLVKK